jgi:hypothetical protein
MKKIVFLLLVTVSYTMVSQSYKELSPSEINSNLEGFNKEDIRISSISAALSPSKVVALNPANMTTDLLNIKSDYRKASNLPSSLVDGWHLVQFTDNTNYLSEAKALVANNRIEKLVVNDYSVNSIAIIKNQTITRAKATIAVSFTSGNTTALDIYFVNDFKQATLTEAPTNPGYVMFWSTHKRGGTAELRINKIKVGKLNGVMMSEPNCLSPNAFTLQLAPGKYDYWVEGKGGKDWSGSFEVFENNCLSLLFNKENKM